MLIAVPPSPPAQELDLLAATIRTPSETPGVLFSGTRGDTVAYTNIVVSMPKGRPVGTIPWPHHAPGNPETDIVATEVEPLDEASMRTWFRSHENTRRVFVFIHGFNTRFDVAVFRMAQLVVDARIDAAPVLFSWPSRGRLLDFKLDHQNATYARSDLAKLLRTAIDSPNVDEITILAHSMGSWLAMEALRQLALQDGAVSPKIDNLLLASPELDIGLFRRQLEEMGPNRPHVTLFVSRNDQALRLSRVISGGMTRLGAIDLTNEAYRSEIAGIDGLTIVDLTETRGADWINHNIYAESPDVVRLIGQRLTQGQVLTDAQASASLPEAAGDFLGAVMATPIVILDSATPPR
ncbi:esterase [Acuticoccus sediminis]|uniref:Esterase n=2 Tax=Acuticoccus sediminis TaxID=2184697 RepID=A0A8B2NZJ1_9HYPH|nr:alpha/beta fold hydrolase [Acuticoccus sediminis]RAI01980.1 esterase [Acuticoccus sediminis]